MSDGTLENFLAQHRSVEVRWTAVMNNGTQIDELLQALSAMPPVTLPQAILAWLLSVIDGQSTARPACDPPSPLYGTQTPLPLELHVRKNAAECLLRHCRGTAQPSLASLNIGTCVMSVLPHSELCRTLLDALGHIAPSPRASLEELRQFGSLLKSSRLSTTPDPAHVNNVGNSVRALCLVLDTQPELVVPGINYCRITFLLWFNVLDVWSAVSAVCCRLLRLAPNNIAVCATIMNFLATAATLRASEVCKDVVEPNVDVIDTVLAIASTESEPTRGELFDSVFRLEQALWLWCSDVGPSAAGGSFSGKLSAMFRKSPQLDPYVEAAKAVALFFSTRSLDNAGCALYAAYRLSQLAQLPPEHVARLRIVVVEKKQLESLCAAVLAEPESSAEPTHAAVLVALRDLISHPLEEEVTRAAANACVALLMAAEGAPATTRKALCATLTAAANLQSDNPSTTTTVLINALLGCNVLTSLSTAAVHAAKNGNADVMDAASEALVALIRITAVRSWVVVHDPCAFLMDISAQPKLAQLAHTLWFNTLTALTAHVGENRSGGHLKSAPIVRMFWTSLREQRRDATRIGLRAAQEALRAPLVKTRRLLQQALTAGLTETIITSLVETCRSIFSAEEDHTATTTSADVDLLLGFYDALVADSFAVEFVLSSRSAAATLPNTFFGLLAARHPNTDEYAALLTQVTKFVLAADNRVRFVSSLSPLLVELARLSAECAEAVASLRAALAGLYDVCVHAISPVLLLLTLPCTKLVETLLALTQLPIADISQLATNCAATLFGFSAPPRAIKHVMRWALRDGNGAQRSVRPHRASVASQIFADGLRMMAEPPAPRTFFVFHQHLGEPGLWARFGPPEGGQRAVSGTTVAMWLFLDPKSLTCAVSLWRLKSGGDADLDCFLVGGQLRLRSTTGTRLAHDALLLPRGTCDEATEITFPAHRWHLLIVTQEEGTLLRAPVTRVYVGGNDTARFVSHRLKAFPSGGPGVLSVGASDEGGLALDSLYGKCGAVTLLRTPLDAECVPLVYEIGANEHFMLLHPHRTKEKFARLIDPALRASVVTGVDPRFVDAARVFSIAPYVLQSVSSTTAVSNADTATVDLKVGTGTMTVETSPISESFVKLSCLRTLVVPLIAAAAGVEFSHGTLHVAARDSSAERRDAVGQALHLLATSTLKSSVQEEAAASGAFHVVGRLLALGDPAVLLSPAAAQSVAAVCSHVHGRPVVLTQAVSGLILNPSLWPQADDAATEAYCAAFASLLSSSSSIKTRLSELGLGRTWLHRVSSRRLMASRHLQSALTSMLCTLWGGTTAAFTEHDACEWMQVLRKMTGSLSQLTELTYAARGGTTAHEEKMLTPSDGDAPSSWSIEDTVFSLISLCDILERCSGSGVPQALAARGALKFALDILRSSPHQLARVTAMRLAIILITTSDEVTSTQLRSYGPARSKTSTGGSEVPAYDLAVLADALKARPITEELYQVIMSAATKPESPDSVVAERIPFMELAWRSCWDARDPKLALIALNGANRIGIRNLGECVWHIQCWYRLLIDLAFAVPSAHHQDGEPHTTVWSDAIEALLVPLMARLFAFNMRRSQASERLNDARCYLDDRRMHCRGTEGIVGRFLATTLRAWFERRETEMLTVGGGVSSGSRVCFKDGLSATETTNIVGLMYALESELFHRHQPPPTSSQQPTVTSAEGEDPFDSQWSLVNAPEGTAEYAEFPSTPMLCRPCSPLGIAHAEAALWAIRIFHLVPSLLHITSPPSAPSVPYSAASQDESLPPSGTQVAVARPGGLRRIALRITRVSVMAQPSIERLERSPLMSCVAGILDKLVPPPPKATPSVGTQALHFLRRDSIKSKDSKKKEPASRPPPPGEAHMALIAALCIALEKLASPPSGGSPATTTPPRRGVGLLAALKQLCQQYKDGIESLLRDQGVAQSKSVKKYQRSVSGKSFVDGVSWLIDPDLVDVEEFVTKIIVMKDVVLLRSRAEAALAAHVAFDSTEIHMDVCMKLAEDQAFMHQRVASEAVARQEQATQSLVSIEGAYVAFMEAMPVEPEPAPELMLLAQQHGVAPDLIDELSLVELDALRLTDAAATRFAAATRGTKLDVKALEPCPFVRIAATETLRGLCIKLEAFAEGSRYPGLTSQRAASPTGGTRQRAVVKKSDARAADAMSDGDDSETASSNHGADPPQAVPADADDDDEPSGTQQSAADAPESPTAAGGGGGALSSAAPFGLNPTAAATAEDITVEAVDMVFFMECCSATLHLTASVLTLTLDPETRSYNQYVSPDAIPFVPKPAWRTFAAQISDITEVAAHRRFRMQRRAMELRFADRTSLLVAFNDRKAMERCVAHLARYARRSSTRFVSSNGREALKAEAMSKWVDGELSNFEYLLALNFHAGRSINDVTQYPIMPWILSDYTSETIDLNDPSCYRDLTLPVGLQGDTAKRRQEVDERYKDLAELDQVPFHYFTHYSSPATVFHFLVRIEPFTAMHIVLQGGRFDHPDRMFHTLASSWAGVKRNHQDVKELVPELFAMPEVYVNMNRVMFGTKQDGSVMDDVVLPPWAKGDSRVLVHTMREALESVYASENLHHWIDLVFGYKQRGRHALEARNLFHPHTYEPLGKDARDAIAKLPEAERRQLFDSLDNIGQCPIQVFQKKHPPRKVTRPPSTLDNIGRVASSTRLASLDAYVSRIAHLHFTETCLIVVATNGAALVFDILPAAITHPAMAATTAATPGGGSAEVQSATPSVVARLFNRSSGGTQLPFSTEPQTRAVALARGAMSFPHDSRHVLAERGAGPLRRSTSCTVLATPDGKTVYIAYAGYFDNSCVLRNLHTKTELVVSTHRGRITTVATTARMTYLATGSADTTVNVYRVELKPETIRVTHRFEITTHDEVISAIALSDEMDTVVSGDVNGAVEVHSLSTGAALFTLRYPEGFTGPRVDSILLQHNAYVPAICTATLGESTVHMWSLNGAFLRTVELPSSFVDWCATADPRYVMLATADGQVTFRHALDLAVAAMAPDTTANSASPTDLEASISSGSPPMPSPTTICLAAHPRHAHLTLSAGPNGLIRCHGWAG